MSKPTQIRQNIMLQEMDIRWLPGDRRNIFSVKFITQSGDLHFFQYAYTCGLPWNVKASRMRGIQPCDKYGNKTDHVYPVVIDNFFQFNTMQVIL